MTAITDEMIDSIAICGPLERCRAGLENMYARGATVPLVPIPTEGSGAEKRRMIESLIR
jgi:hypothetical protein